MRILVLLICAATGCGLPQSGSTTQIANAPVLHPPMPAVVHVEGNRLVVDRGGTWEVVALPDLLPGQQGAGGGWTVITHKEN